MVDNDKLWPSAPADFSLRCDSAHVWDVSLDLSDESLGSLSSQLSTDETRRAAAFHFNRDRNRYIAAHGALRIILGRYLLCPSAAIRFVEGPHGKPSLGEGFARTGLQFNLAHCEDRALLAVTRDRAVGVDLERIRAMSGADEMAEVFCSARENSEFQSLPDVERNAAFFRLWTRKEAWLKATGEGIGLLLNKVEVTFGAGQAACFVRLPDEAGAPADGWTLEELTPAPGFLGAVAARGQAVDLSCWNWKEEEHVEYVYS